MYCPKCGNLTMCIKDWEYQKDWMDNFWGAYHDSYTEIYECPECDSIVEVTVPVTVTIGESKDE